MPFCVAKLINQNASPIQMNRSHRPSCLCCAFSLSAQVLQSNSIQWTDRHSAKEQYSAIQLLDQQRLLAFTAVNMPAPDTEK